MIRGLSFLPLDPIIAERLRWSLEASRSRIDTVHLTAEHLLRGTAVVPMLSCLMLGTVSAYMASVS
jgi:hypothetical protein